MTMRRDFLTRMAFGAAAFAIDPDELHAERRGSYAGPWDTSWIAKVEAAKYRVVFNANEINEGAVLSYVSAFLDDLKAAEGISDTQARAVVVARRSGVSLGVNDAMWDKYAIGAYTKTDDPVTQQPARRNPFWLKADRPDANPSRIEPLQKRGLIVLVCSVALGSLGYTLATQTKRDVPEVQAELRSNLVPGAILLPSGIYGLIRAQNAGCAYMTG